MCHVVVVQQIALKRSNVVLGAAMLQANFVIDPSVVDKCVEPAEFFNCVLNC